MIEEHYKARRPLRWFANLSNSIAHYFFEKGLAISNRYEGYEIPINKYRAMNRYHRLWLFFDRPAQKWGTYYTITCSNIDFSEKVDKEDL